MSHVLNSVVEARCRNLVNHLRQTILDPGNTVPLKARCARTPDPVPWARRKRLTYRDVAEGDRWGETWDSGWFHLQGRVPAAWAGAHVVARIDLAGEVLVFDAKGCPLAGLTKGSVFDEDYAKDLLHLYQPARGGEKVSLWLEAAANGLFGVERPLPEYNHGRKPLHGHHRGVVNALRLCRLDEAAYALLHDLEVLQSLVKGMHEGAPRRAKVLRALDRAVGEYDRAGTDAARAALRPVFEVPADPGAIRFTGVGHAHIDVGWLWRVRESARKAGRTFSSQLGLIARYPGYVFGASQAQLYAAVERDYPALFAKVREAVAAGRWEVQGAMWVEADCNLPGGESLVRQVLVGKRWFKAAFGVNVRNLWLPDVFGYSGQLPQILRKAGVDYFLTQKLSWNKTNEFPHNTFVWRGIDGSDVLAHFPPENDYNAKCRPEALIRAQDRHKERGIIDEAISLFGIGDGGGGPKEEFIERGLRMADLNGCPPLRFGAVQPVLERMNAFRAEYDTWFGELYFELHRATYTTQAAIKRANRRAEEALRAAEMLCAAAAPSAYPRDAFAASWRTVLTNQFHDIIPGSSIHAVYDDAVPEDEAVAADCAQRAAQAAAGAMAADAAAATLFNPSGSEFDDRVRLPDGWRGATVAGEAVPSQADADGVWARVRVPGQQAVVLRRSTGARQGVSEAVPAAGTVLENDAARYAFDGAGRLTSAVLKGAGGGEFLAAGETGNALTIYEDRPHSWDAWDIDDQYRLAPRGTFDVVSAERADGLLGVELRLRGRVGRSAMTQHIRLRPGSARLDFVTTVDWQEQHKLLRVEFPTNLLAEECAYEIQYGYVLRPTHRNTSWDSARFEVCGHRWADLSERSRGLALLNDCKYGYSCRGGTLGLSLLRASTQPDPVADLGTHRFTYAILPHAGGLEAVTRVRAEAAMLNQGVVRLDGLDGGAFRLPVTVEGEGLELAVLKLAEDDGSLIARVVETRGAGATGRLVAPGRRIVPTDLMEWGDRPKAGSKGSLDLALGRFAIETFRIV